MQGFRISELSNDISLKEFYLKRDKILLVRGTGGIGDILMCRMMFEDFKLLNPKCHLTFACPLKYHDLITDHPFVDKVIDCCNVNLSDYVVTYNISEACGKYEKRKAPFADKNRADIWASHCGIELKRHDMHLTVNREVESRCRSILEANASNRNIVLLSPMSAIRSKDLDKTQINELIDGLKTTGSSVVCLHRQVIKEINAPTIVADSLINFLGFIKAANYIITVDTGTFHAAGGLNKPMVGVFSWSDGKVYGKWYKNWILVQKHRDNGDWECGPCYLWYNCCKDKINYRKPCITQITASEIVEAAKKLMIMYPLEKECQVE